MADTLSCASTLRPASRFTANFTGFRDARLRHSRGPEPINSLPATVLPRSKFGHVTLAGGPDTWK